MHTPSRWHQHKIIHERQFQIKKISHDQRLFLLTNLSNKRLKITTIFTSFTFAFTHFLRFYRERQKII